MWSFCTRVLVLSYIMYFCLPAVVTLQITCCIRAKAANYQTVNCVIICSIIMMIISTSSLLHRAKVCVCVCVCVWLTEGTCPYFFSHGLILLVCSFSSTSCRAPSWTHTHTHTHMLMTIRTHRVMESNWGHLLECHVCSTTFQRDKQLLIKNYTIYNTNTV